MFGKLASMFVEVDGGVSKAQPPPKKDPESKEPVEEPKPVETVQSIGAQVDPKMLELLEDAIKNADLEGYDYLEFRNSLADMAALPMAESQKYAAVFAAVKSLTTRDHLLSSINHYMDVLKKKSEEFSNYVSDLEVKEIGERKQKIEELSSEITLLGDELSKLQVKIQEKQLQVQTLGSEIQEKTLDINAKKSAFETTLTSVVGRLNEDKTKIETYVGE
jgi:hypothetical protein